MLFFFFPPINCIFYMMHLPTSWKAPIRTMPVQEFCHEQNILKDSLFTAVSWVSVHHYQALLDSTIHILQTKLRSKLYKPISSEITNFLIFSCWPKIGLEDPLLSIQKKRDTKCSFQRSKHTTKRRKTSLWLSFNFWLLELLFLSSVGSKTRAWCQSGSKAFLDTFQRHCVV